MYRDRYPARHRDALALRSGGASVVREMEGMAMWACDTGMVAMSQVIEQLVGGLGFGVGALVDPERTGNYPWTVAR